MTDRSSAPGFQIDAEKNQDTRALAAKYSVRAFPTFVFLKNGQKVDEVRAFSISPGQTR